MKKNYVLSIFMFIILMCLTSCNTGGTNPDDNKGPSGDENPIVTSVSEVEEWLLKEVDTVVIDSDLAPLPTTYNDTDVTINWESSNAKRIDNTGKVIQRDTKKITDVDLTYTIVNEKGEEKTGVIQLNYILEHLIIWLLHLQNNSLKDYKKI